MNREVTNVLSTGLDVYNCIVCLFMMISVAGELRTNKANRMFFFTCLSVLVFNIADISNWQMEGLTPAWHVPALHILTFVFYFVVPFCFYFLLKYIEEYLKPYKVKFWYLSFSLVISGFYMMGVLISPFTGFYYSITPDNYYQRGEFNYISTVFFGIFFLFTFIMIIMNRKHFPRRSILPFLSYVFFPITCQIIQIKFYGLSLVNLGMTCSLLLIFVNAHHDLKVSLARKEREKFQNEKKVMKLQRNIIRGFSDLICNRTLEDGEHAKRTGAIIQALANQALKDGVYTEYLTEGFIFFMKRGTSFYDIGKIAMPDLVLKKNAKLNDYEYQSMANHPEAGVQIIDKIFEHDKDDEFYPIARDMTLYHHERWDGTGYPKGLKADEIPLSARFMSIADVFDALVYRRCYKEAMFVDDAFEIMERSAGSQFDPALIDEFMKIKSEIMGILSVYEEGR